MNIALLLTGITVMVLGGIMFHFMWDVNDDTTLLAGVGSIILIFTGYFLSFEGLLGWGWGIAAIITYIFCSLGWVRYKYGEIF